MDTLQNDANFTDEEGGTKGELSAPCEPLPLLVIPTLYQGIKKPNMLVQV